MAEDIRPRSTKSGAQTRQRRGTRTDHGRDLGEMLSRVGINEEKVKGVKSYVVGAVESRVRNLDTEDAMDRTLEMAGTVVSKLRENARKNPSMFFGGLTAAAVGVGMMLAAGRELRLEDKSGTRSRRTNRVDYEVE